jgi:hypothetical protein
VREIAGRIASALSGINFLIALAAEAATAGAIAYNLVHALVDPQGINRLYALALGLPALILAPIIVFLIVRLPLLGLIYILAGSTNTSAVRIEHKLFGFIDRTERLTGKRPSQEEIDGVYSDLVQRNYAMTKMVASACWP